MSSVEAEASSGLKTSAGNTGSSSSWGCSQMRLRGLSGSNRAYSGEMLYGENPGVEKLMSTLSEFQAKSIKHCFLIPTTPGS